MIDRSKVDLKKGRELIENFAGQIQIAHALGQTPGQMALRFGVSLATILAVLKFLGLI